MEPLGRAPGTPGALPLRRLARGRAQWDVYLEAEPHPDLAAIRGRLHFVCDERHQVSAWIFLEWTEKEVVDRARRFTAGELTAFLDALTA